MSILKKLAQRAALAVGVIATTITVVVKYGAVAAAAVGVTSTVGVIAIKAAMWIATARIASMVAQGIIRYTGFGDVEASAIEVLNEVSDAAPSCMTGPDMMNELMSRLAEAGYSNTDDVGAGAHQTMFHSGC